MHMRKLFLQFVVLASCLALVPFAFGQAENPGLGRPGFGRQLEKLTQKISSSVVGVRVVEARPAPSGDDVRPGATAIAPRKALLNVSGIVLSKTGEVATLFKDGLPVARKGGAIVVEVTLSDGEVYKAEWLNTDHTSGISLIKIVDAPKSKLRPVRWARKDAQPGAMVLGIGCSFGMSQSYNLGMVSGPNRRMRHPAFPQLVRVSLTANPGDVGGLLANDQGQCLGMLALAFGDGQGSLPRSSGSRHVFANKGNGGPALSRGIVFAIPSNVLQTVCVQLRKKGKVDRGALGADFYFVNRAEAQCECSSHRCYGVYVMSVEPGGTAAAIGLQHGDFIVNVDQRDMMTVSDMFWFAEKVQYGAIGSKLRLVVHRHADESTIKLLQAPVGSLAELEASRKPSPETAPKTDAKPKRAN